MCAAVYPHIFLRHLSERLTVEITAYIFFFKKKKSVGVVVVCWRTVLVVYLFGVREIGTNDLYNYASCRLSGNLFSFCQTRDAKPDTSFKCTISSPTQELASFSRRRGFSVTKGKVEGGRAFDVTNRSASVWSMRMTHFVQVKK